MTLEEKNEIAAIQKKYKD